MITQPLLLSLVLLSVVVVVLFLQKLPSLSKLFHYLPAPFWCYFIPMLLATAGVLPEKSAVYSFLTTYLLSGVLILLLLNVNLPSILRLGPTALGALAVGSFGIGLGAVVSHAIFHRWLPEETWKGVGALAASWTGGSANMLAVKEGLQAPDAVFAPLIIVDTIVTYTWMGIVIALAAFQERWDRWVKADRTTLENAAQQLTFPPLKKGGSGGFSNGKSLPTSLFQREEPHFFHAIWLIGLSMLIGAGFLALGRKLPTFHGVLNPSAWAFLLVTLFGIALSFTPASKLERYGASRWGYFCLYLLLAAIGAKANLQHIFKAPVFLLMAIPWVAIHALLLGLYGYFRHVPMFFLAAASQANIGGTASAPIVAGVYQPRLAPVGLLLAIAVNIVGTYLGYLIAYACRFTAH